MAVNIVKKQANGTVVVHVTGTQTINCTGNDSVSDLATTGEVVSKAHIKQVWCGSPSGNSSYWAVTRGNSSVNTLVGVYDSAAWIDYAGNGGALTLSSDGEFVYCTITAADASSAYIMIEFKKELIS